MLLRAFSRRSLAMQKSRRNGPFFALSYLGPRPKASHFRDVTMTTPIPSPEKSTLMRESIYNARVTEILSLHESLRVLRIVPDTGPLTFTPGQYVSLGLGRWESGDRLENVEQAELGHMIKRAYSISSPILDNEGRLVRADALDYLEFYITLVTHLRPHPPSLTPRLFHLKVGDRLWMGTQPRGSYTLRPYGPEDHIVFMATGTGEAPHNAMIADLLSRGHEGPITSLVCVRLRRDLGYLKQHAELEARYPNYRYSPLTTREPENISPKHSRYVGKRYIQDVFRSWEESLPQQPLPTPETSHVYLCGNPAMIGVPKSLQQIPRVYPKPTGMVEILEQLGFRLDQPRRPGNIHIEKYW